MIRALALLAIVGIAMASQCPSPAELTKATEPLR